MEQPFFYLWKHLHIRWPLIQVVIWFHHIAALVHLPYSDFHNEHFFSYHLRSISIVENVFFVKYDLVCVLLPSIKIYLHKPFFESGWGFTFNFKLNSWRNRLNFTLLVFRLNQSFAIILFVVHFCIPSRISIGIPKNSHKNRYLFLALNRPPFT